MKRMLLAGSVLLTLVISADARNGLPDTMVGQWCFQDGDAEGEAIYFRGQCVDADALFTVKRNSYQGTGGAVCELNHVRRLTDHVYMVDVYCGGKWTEKTLFKLMGQSLQLEPIDRSINHSDD
jgi:hypothetical protein